MYIPPEERQQPKSWEQTNKRRGKETKQIKLNDKGLLIHHSLVNLVSSEALMRCCAAPVTFDIKAGPICQLGCFSHISPQGGAKVQSTALKRSKPPCDSNSVISFTVHPDCCTRIGGKTDLHSPGVSGCKDSQTGNDSSIRVGDLAQKLAVNLYNRERS